MTEGERLFTVGVLAKKFSTTIRTLQFYDSSGLVKPSYHSDGGRRLYGSRDILKLQQILFLKSFGFSLDEIREKLLNIQNANDFIPVLESQKAVIAGQICNLQNAVLKIDTVIDEIQDSGEIPLEKLVAILNVMKEGNKFAHVLKYFENDKLPELLNLDGHLKEVDVSARMQAMVEEMISLHKAGVEPESEKGVDIAQRWMDLVYLITRGDPELLKSAFAAGDDVDNWPDSMGEYKLIIKEFLSRAMEAWKKKNEGENKSWKQ